MNTMPDITFEEATEIIHCMDNIEDVSDIDVFTLTNGVIIQERKRMAYNEEC